MTEILEESRQRMRRSLGLELVRLEDDFDQTRDMRKELTESLMQEALKMKLCDAEGNINDDTPTKLAVKQAALKALNDTEKASVNAVSMKLRQQEADTASAAVHKDRMAAVLEATKPGRITVDIDVEKIQEKFDQMFEGQIKDTELKTNPADLSS